MCLMQEGVEEPLSIDAQADSSHGAHAARLLHLSVRPRAGLPSIEGERPQGPAIHMDG